MYIVKSTESWDAKVDAEKEEPIMERKPKKLSKRRMICY
jgi:hypothetical protein